MSFLLHYCRQQGRHVNEELSGLDAHRWQGAPSAPEESCTAWEAAHKPAQGPDSLSMLMTCPISKTLCTQAAPPRQGPASSARRVRAHPLLCALCLLERILVAPCQPVIPLLQAAARGRLSKLAAHSLAHNKQGAHTTDRAPGKQDLHRQLSTRRDS